MALHMITRVRQELRRRRLEVLRNEVVTPAMRRVVLGGAELNGFSTPSPDDHIKIAVPGPDGVERRYYTPRRYDAATGELSIDLALHGHGPAAAWASRAKSGDVMEIGGPRGSTLVPADFDWWLLIGDETALPAIGRRVEELAEGTPVLTLAAVTGPEEEQAWATSAAHRPTWVHRAAERAGDPEPLLDALRSLVLLPGDGFVWIAAEAHVARVLRAHVLATIHHPPEWTKASGYWIRGVADGHATLDA